MKSNTQQSLDTDQKIAQEALKKAYARETETLVAEINQKASQITDINDIWALSDYFLNITHFFFIKILSIILLLLQFSY